VWEIFLNMGGYQGALIKASKSSIKKVGTIRLIPS